MAEYALAATATVRWLVSSDKGVMDAVKLFIAGAAPLPYLDVAGPPQLLEAADARRRGQTVPLPCVRLNMQIRKHHLTGELGVVVMCSDADHDEIQRWQRLAAMPKIGRA